MLKIKRSGAGGLGKSDTELPGAREDAQGLGGGSPSRLCAPSLKQEDMLRDRGLKETESRMTFFQSWPRVP